MTFINSKTLSVNGRNYQSKKGFILLPFRMSDRDVRYWREHYATKTVYLGQQFDGDYYAISNVSDKVDLLV